MSGPRAANSRQADRRGQGRTTDEATACAGLAGTTIHDLRHTAASLLEWYRDGEDVAARMPRLSTYLGHVDPKSTYWYLTGTPELLALAADRLERADLGERP